MDTLDNCFDHGSKGSFLEADLHYPDKLHNLYNFKICIICTIIILQNLKKYESQKIV